MSLSIIRKAFEKRLAVMSPVLATAYENVLYAPVTGTPYQRINLIPATPNNTIQGAATYFERGYFQITLCYPIGSGPAGAETQAQLVRSHFKRGLSMLESGVTVLVTDTPRAAPALMDGDRYCIPISIPFQAQIST